MTQRVNANPSSRQAAAITTVHSFFKERLSVPLHEELAMYTDPKSVLATFFLARTKGPSTNDVHKIFGLFGQLPHCHLQSLATYGLSTTDFGTESISLGLLSLNLQFLFDPIKYEELLHVYSGEEIAELYRPFRRYTEHCPAVLAEWHRKRQRQKGKGKHHRRFRNTMPL